MSEHYFTDKPVTASNRKKISAEIRGITLHFFTDTSVFSRQAVDFGSRLLIETAELPAEGTVLDMGCGYGAIGLFAARQLKKGTVTMVDINERQSGWRGTMPN